MGNIITYLKWRGDITLAACPFGLVDNLILSMLAYIDFSGIVPKLNEPGNITVKEAISQYKARENKKLDSVILPEFLDVIAKSKRFQTMLLSNYIDETDFVSQIQFSALHIQLDDNYVYISFCGTNDEIVGWREDFSMSYQVMPSQKKAVEYLEKTITESKIKYYIGGHSKGGNLAVYGAAYCSQEKQQQIMTIYSNDGPGLCPEIIELDRYEIIKHKVVRIIPEFSLIGKLFEREDPDVIVKSSVQGVIAHDGFTWEVEGNRFITSDTCDKKSSFMNEIIDEWIKSASFEQRKSFTKDLFDALEAKGAKKMSEIAVNGIDNVESILIALVRSESKTKIVIMKFFSSVINKLHKINWKKALKTKEIIGGVICFVLGLLIIAKPLLAIRSISVVLGVIVLSMAWKKLLNNVKKRDIETTYMQRKLALYIAVMGVIITLLNQINFITGFTELLISGSFLGFAYCNARKTFRVNKNIFLRCYYGAVSLLSLLFGILPVTTYAFGLTTYTFTAGTFIVIHGIIIIVKQIYRESKMVFNISET